MFLKPYKLWGFNYLSLNHQHPITSICPAQGESYEAVGADFIDAKDGLTLIALEEGGTRYHWEDTMSCCLVLKLGVSKLVACGGF